LHNYNNAAVSSKPPGLVVGVLGRDGAGKSTFLNCFAEAMSPYFTGIQKFHTFAGFIYKRGMIPRRTNNFDLTKPHKEKIRDRFTSFLKVNLFFTESFLGYWFKVRPLKSRSNLVLFDRSFVDVLADPVRYRMNISKGYVKLLFHLLPKPDVWIILDLPSDILVKRKQDLNYEMAEKLRYEYLHLQNLLTNCIVINNKNQLDETIDEATRFVLGHLDHRANRVA